MEILGWITITIIVMCLIIGGGLIGFGIADSRHLNCPESISLRDVNMLLKEEGYKIYFRVNDGQFALVHPAQNRGKK